MCARSVYTTVSNIWRCSKTWSVTHNNLSCQQPELKNIWRADSASTLKSKFHYFSVVQNMLVLQCSICCVLYQNYHWHYRYRLKPGRLRHVTKKSETRFLTRSLVSDQGMSSSPTFSTSHRLSAHNMLEIRLQQDGSNGIWTLPNIHFKQQWFNLNNLCILYDRSPLTGAVFQWDPHTALSLRPLVYQ